MRLPLRIPLLGPLCAAGLAVSLAACGATSSHPTVTTTAGGSTTTISVAPTTTTPASGHRPGLVSIIEDDQALITDPTGTLASFASLGAQVVRYNALWSSYTPDDSSRTMPSGFDASNPGAAGYSWAVLDAVDRDVSGARMRLYLTLMPAAPLWATGRDVPAALDKNPCTVCDHWKPSAADYEQWVEAVGKRYSGHYTPPGQTTPLPRVSFWSIWNEPNFGPRLAPQSVTNAQNQVVDTAAPQYRKLVEAGWQGLSATGHTPKSDTILIGETAPRGVLDPGYTSTTSPLQFIRDLYCVDGNFKPLTGTVASALGCPTNGSSAAFAKNNPALFQASGWADHPYPDGIAPTVRAGSATQAVGWADFARLDDLEGALDKALGAWGSHTEYKIYNTEFGYFTDPPFKAYDSIAPMKAAAYLNEAEYLSWKDPRIASYDQYLLKDSPADTPTPFDTGLEFSTGAHITPVYNAYRLPLWLPTTTGKPGHSLEVWGCARPALTAPATSDTVAIQFASGTSGFTTLATETIHPAASGCYFDTRVTFPHSGKVRLAYHQGSATVVSRTQAITVQ